MISFKDFIEGIHSAILAANESLVSKNEEVLEKYFDIMPSKNTGGKNSESNVYSPKTIVIQCPKHTEEGVVMQDVHMPLITIAPVTMSQIEKVKLNVDLEMQLNGDELNVGFEAASRQNSHASKNGESGTKNPLLAHVEIVLRPHEGPEGLSTLIKGYEKALRAQIPG